MCKKVVAYIMVMITGLLSTSVLAYGNDDTVITVAATTAANPTVNAGASSTLTAPNVSPNTGMPSSSTVNIRGVTPNTAGDNLRSNVTTQDNAAVQNNANTRTNTQNNSAAQNNVTTQNTQSTVRNTTPAQGTVQNTTPAQSTVQSATPAPTVRSGTGTNPSTLPNGAYAPYGIDPTTGNPRIAPDYSVSDAQSFPYLGISPGSGAVMTREGEATGEALDTTEIYDVDNYGYPLASDVRNTQYAEAAELLGALGIMVGDAQTGAFRPNDTIIRSEAAKVAVHMLGLELLTSGTADTQYSDVNTGHWASGVIEVASSQGLVVGYPEGTFRPDNNVSLAEAVTMVVRGLGYEPAAASNGGFPTGYLVIAAQNGLLKGVVGSAEDNATRGDIAQLVFNALTANIMEQVAYGRDITYEIVEKTVLSDKLDVIQSRGTIVANYETRLGGDSNLREDEVEINELIYKVGNTTARNLLGYNVLFYSKKETTTEPRTLLVARPEASRNNVLSITATNIHSVEADANGRITLRYWVNKATDREPRRAIIHQEANLIYNGKAETLAIEDLTPTAGNIILLDTGSTDVFNTVFVNQFVNLVVEDVSEQTGLITDKLGVTSLILDEMDTTTKFSVILNGSNVGISELREWDVLSITRSRDEELVKAYVSRKPIEGIVSEITTETYNEQELYRYIINGYEYQVAANFIEAGEVVRLQDKGKFYLDIEGKIAAADLSATITENYAYLVAGAEVGAFEPILQFKLFTKDGETRVINGATRIRVNEFTGTSGSRSLTVDEVLGLSNLFNSGVAIPQLVTYELNSRGEIVELNSGYNAESNEGVPTRDKFTMNRSGTFNYRKASGRLGPAILTNSTVVFDIPQNAGSDTALYGVRNISSLSDDTEYTVEIYDMALDFTAGAIVMTNALGTAAPESMIAVVERITQTQNAELTSVDKLYAFQDGKRIDILASDRGGVLTKDGVPLQLGDIIQYRTNARGEIDRITVLFDIATKTEEKISNTFPPENIPSDDLEVAYGRVTRRFAGSINLSVNDVIYPFSTTGVTVYDVDTTRSTNQVRVVTPADIQVFIEDLNERRVFVKTFKDEVTEMVIIR